MVTTMKKYAGKIICMMMVVSTLIFCFFTFASAKVKVPKNPIVILSTKETDALWNKMDKNIIYVEKAYGKVKNKKGDGYNLSNPNYYINFSCDRYKGKKLPKGAKVTCFFVMGNNPDHDCIARIDYYKGVIVHMSDIQS